MHLKSVELRDWRSYRHARFEFPPTQENKNVILVRAPNEHGKTSFFEAVTLGLFGRDGLFMVPRARVALTGEIQDRQAITYSQFLQGVLHRRAIAQGRQSCSVTLEFIDEDGEHIELVRKWHFSARGEHKPAEDALLIYEGLERLPVALPATVTDRDAWYRDYIAKTFLPAPLAEFFLFDGEQVQRYANKGMASQVKQGIEGLLGLPILKSLRESLIKYAQAKRAGVAAPSDEVVQRVELAIQKLEEQIEKDRSQLNQALQLLPALQQESSNLIQQLGRGGEGSVALLGELFKEEQALRSEAQRATESLERILASDVAIAIAGPELREAAVARLNAEKIREEWDSAKNRSNTNLDRFVNELVVRLGVGEPSLQAKQISRVIEEVANSWDTLWHPAPEGSAESFLHSALTGSIRLQTVARLNEVAQRSSADLTSLVSTFRTSLELAEAKKRERLELERLAPETEGLSNRLKQISEEIGRLESQKDSAQRSLDMSEAELGSKRAELGRYMESKGKGGPALSNAATAERVSETLSEILNEAVPTQVTAIAEAMTVAWQNMAHMSDRVSKIEITPECEVRMLNKKGENLHDIDKSAGAMQIFTQALIWAVTHVSGQKFPFIVDTPLARLSRQQRLGVLKTFTNRSGQVILLSTDEEVVDDKLDAIRDKILIAYQLKVRQEDGVVTTVVERDDI